MITCNVRFTTMPFRFLSDQVWIRYPCCVSMNCLFYLRFLCKVTCAFFSQKKHWRNVRVRKNTISGRFLIRWRVQGYRCKSGIDDFAWRVIWNTVPITVLVDAIYRVTNPIHCSTLKSIFYDQECMRYLSSALKIDRFSITWLSHFYF